MVVRKLFALGVTHLVINASVFLPLQNIVLLAASPSVVFKTIGHELGSEAVGLNLHRHGVTQLITNVGPDSASILGGLVVRHDLLGGMTLHNIDENAVKPLHLHRVELSVGDDIVHIDKMVESLGLKGLFEAFFPPDEVSFVLEGLELLGVGLDTLLPIANVLGNLVGGLDPGLELGARIVMRAGSPCKILLRVKSGRDEIGLVLATTKMVVREKALE